MARPQSVPDQLARAMNAAVDVEHDDNAGRTDAEGSIAPDWRVTAAAVPCRILKDPRRRAIRGNVGMAEVVEADTILAFTTPIAATAAAERIAYRDPALGDRTFEIVRVDNVHEMGRLWVAHCREYPA